MTTLSATRRWHIENNKDHGKIESISRELKISPLMAELLHSRKLHDKTAIDAFFLYDETRLHDPFLMLNMQKAVDRLSEAIGSKQKIMVYGDYDVDGTTSVAMMYSFLKEKTPCLYYIPDRYEEGYGFSRKGVETAKSENCSLIITLDCGIKDFEVAQFAAEAGIDVIICDHHTPGESVPNAVVLDPRQSGCDYPFKELSGCGVGFKLLQAWCISNGTDFSEIAEYLDLLAVSIAADIVSVSDENRVLAQFGLELLNKSLRPGLQALFELAPREGMLKLSDLVFGFAPKINAAGRLDSGMKAVQLLITGNISEARKIAREINIFNEKRKEIELQITADALEMITSGETGLHSTVVYKDDWHKGVVGIVASRLIESHYRPTVVLTEANGTATGSARTVEGFNLYEALNECSDLLHKFGGHFHAAGLSLSLENVPAFQRRFDEIASRSLTVMEREERLQIDHEVRFSDLFLSGESIKGLPRIYRMLERMEPFGPDNSKPVFMISSVYATEFRILKEKHLKLSVFDPESAVTLPAIGFNMAHLQDLVASGCAFDCAFTLESNTWNRSITLQLQIRDIRPA